MEPQEKGGAWNAAGLVFFPNLCAVLNDALHDSAFTAPLINSGERKSFVAPR